MVEPIHSLRVYDVMSTDLVQAGIDEPVSEAVWKMLEKNVGCILVIDSGLLKGIITKGDVLRKAFLQGFDAREVSCKRVMSQPAFTICEDSSIEEAAKLMTEKNVSKLPVVREDKPVGIVTSTDLIRAEPVQVGYLQELIRARYIPHERI